MPSGADTEVRAAAILFLAPGERCARLGVERTAAGSIQVGCRLALKQVKVFAKNGKET